MPPAIFSTNQIRYEIRRKMKQPFIFAVSLIFLATLVTGQGIGPGQQDFGYVTVRPGAHMFWWLYYTSANVTDPTERPLIVWLAGGPGSSATGYGNFWIVGPVDENLQPREHNWVKDYNILFIDNPVGAGYSYVENYRLLNNNNLEIARDLVDTMKGFFEKLPAFKTSPLYMYGISYGGKMVTDFALMLDEDVRLGYIECDFKGVLMGNAWISPMDNTLAYARLLYQMGLVDERGESLIDEQAQYTNLMHEQGEYFLSRVEWVRTMYYIDALTDGVDIYNLTAKPLKPTKARSLKEFEEQLNHKMIHPRDRYLEMFLFMNGPVKEALNIPSFVIWSAQANELILNLYAEFMTSVTPSMEKLLNNTNIDVHICNGNMDLIVPTPGVMEYIDKLEWRDKEAFRNAPRTTMWVNNTMEGYEKHGGRLYFYWLNVASHDAITDSPFGTREFLRAATGI